MTAADLTIAQLEELENVLAVSCQAVRRIRLQSLAGDIGPDDAMIAVIESVDPIDQWFAIPDDDEEIEPSAEDVAAHKGDLDQQRIKDES